MATIADEFISLGDEGLGTPSSTIAHSMAWFRGGIFVGCTNPGGKGPDDAARIMRYDPQTGEWDEVYRSPLVPPDARSSATDVQVSSHMGKFGKFKQQEHDRVPLDNGYRSMTIFQGRSDREPCLYVSSLSPWGARILRSEDGETFVPVSEPGFGDSTILSFRGLTACNGKLFASPAGTCTDEYLDRNFAPVINVYCSDDPGSGEWTPAAEPCFGDEENGVIYSLACFDDHLYAGTGNHERGFQLWRTDAGGEAPFRWERVLADGAYRGNLNMATAAMVAFDGALYVGGGIPGFGYDKANDVGPAACELIRVFPDGRWDLVVGTPRFTPDGLKVPLSGMGAGMDDPYNSVVWTMGVHDDVLYIGTHQWEPFESIKPGHDGGLTGGYQVWATEDGETLVPVTMDAFGDPTATGLRTILSTPHGVVLGTANHKPLLLLLARLAGSEVDQPGEGGFEILLGTATADASTTHA